MSTALRLAMVLQCANHKVITRYEPGPNMPPCPENECILYGVQLVQADIDLCIEALKEKASARERGLVMAKSGVYIGKEVSDADAELVSLTLALEAAATGKANLGIRGMQFLCWQAARLFRATRPDLVFHEAGEVMTAIGMIDGDMGQLTKQLRKTTDGFSWYCPACEEAHPLPYKKGWTWNGNVWFPTFAPSFKHTGMQTIKKDGVWTGEWVRDANGNPVQEVCHYILSNAQVAYCGDCTHAYAGKTIPLPDLPPFLCDEEFKA